MRKGKFLGSLAFISALALVGCSNADTGANTVDVVTTIDNPVEVEFWHSMSGAFDKTIKDLVEDFNSTIGAEKGITVNAVFQGSYDDTKAKVTASLKSGNSPEIVQAMGNHVAEYLESGSVQALDDYIFNDEVGIKDFTDIYEVYRSENSQYTEEGTFYSLPFNKSTDLLFYNKTFFEENNLTIPTTWDELVDVSTQITEITGKPALSIDNTANYLITLLEQKGAGYTAFNGDILFNNEASVEALNMIQENTKTGIWRLAGEDKYSSTPFLAGNVAMYIGSSAGEGFLNDDKFVWDTAQVPQVDPSNPAYIQQGSNLAILNQDKTNEEVYGAFEFIKYLCSYEANLNWSLNTGYLPIRESVANSETYVNSIEQTGSRTKVNATASVPFGFVESAFSTGYYSSNRARSEVGAMVEDVILNGLDPQEALNLYEGKLK